MICGINHFLFRKAKNILVRTGYRLKIGYSSIKQQDIRFYVQLLVKKEKEDLFPPLENQYGSLFWVLLAFFVPFVPVLIDVLLSPYNCSSCSLRTSRKSPFI